jgi:chalcone isomerase-like protein
MKTTSILAALLAFGVGSAALAGEVAGVKVPDVTTIEGKTLKLNGVGLRKKMMFKVYVASLYVETPSKDAGTVIATDMVKSIQLHILRGLSGSEIGEAIADGFHRNSNAQMRALGERLLKLQGMFPAVVDGDLIVLTYVPGKGTLVSAKGQDKGVIEGKDFADALFAVWLGANPVQDDLKAALLAGS